MSHWEDDCNRNRGASEDSFLAANMDVRALIGHKAEAPKEGMVTVVEETRSWIVLDHFIMTVAPESEKIISPTQRRLVESKALTACVSILDNVKNEKKQNKYNAVKTCELGRC